MIESALAEWVCMLRKTGTKQQAKQEPPSCQIAEARPTPSSCSSGLPGRNRAVTRSCTHSSIARTQGTYAKVWPDVIEIKSSYAMTYCRSWGTSMSPSFQSRPSAMTMLCRTRPTSSTSSSARARAENSEEEVTCEHERRNRKEPVTHFLAFPSLRFSSFPFRLLAQPQHPTQTVEHRILAFILHLPRYTAQNQSHSLESRK